MSALYGYALVADPGGALPAGLQGEPLRAVGDAGVWAIVGEVEDAPGVDPATLRGHDRVVRELAKPREAILPVRFGTLLGDEGSLRARLQRRLDPLRAALARVRGCEQMTVRFFGQAIADPAPEPAGSGSGPGTRYLARRRQQRDLPAAATIRAALASLVVEELQQPHERGAQLATVYHLIRSGQAGAYHAAIGAARAMVLPVVVTTSGPWPPYGFTAGGAL